MSGVNFYRRAAAAALAVLVASGVVLTFSRNNHWRDEWTIFMDVYAKSYSKTRAHVIIGRMHKLQNRPYDALREYFWVLERDPKRVDMHNNIGVAYLSLDRYDEAELEFNKVLGSKRFAGAAHTNMGNVFYARGELRKALEWYLKAVEFDRLTPVPLENAGFVYIDLKQYGDAVEVFKKAVEVNPDSFNAYYGLALASEEGGDYGSAAGYWRVFLSLAPDVPGYRDWVEAGRRRLKRIEEMRVKGG